MARLRQRLCAQRLGTATSGTRRLGLRMPHARPNGLPELPLGKRSRACAREAKRDQDQVVEISGSPNPETGKNRRATAERQRFPTKAWSGGTSGVRSAMWVHGSFASRPPPNRSETAGRAECRGWARMRRIECLRASRCPGCAGSPLRVSERIPSPIIIRLPGESRGPWLRRTNFASVGEALRLCDAQASADKWIPAFAGNAASDLRSR